MTALERAAYQLRAMESRNRLDIGAIAGRTLRGKAAESAKQRRMGGSVASVKRY